MDRQEEKAIFRTRLLSAIYAEIQAHCPLARIDYDEEIRKRGDTVWMRPPGGGQLIVDQAYRSAYPPSMLGVDLEEYSKDVVFKLFGQHAGSASLHIDKFAAQIFDIDGCAVERFEIVYGYEFKKESLGVKIPITKKAEPKAATVTDAMKGEPGNKPPLGEENICETCSYGNGVLFSLECRKSSPPWPRVKNWDWCGEYRRKQEEVDR